MENTSNNKGKTKFKRLLTWYNSLSNGVKFLIWIGVFIILVKLFPGDKNESFSSSSTTSSVNHKCTWCGSSYSGKGFHHIGSSCEVASNGWEKYDNKCSMKCCEESWNNGKH